VISNNGQTQSEERVLVIFGGGTGSTIAAWTFTEEEKRVDKTAVRVWLTLAFE
jgi:hypothetical protein